MLRGFGAGNLVYVWIPGWKDGTVEIPRRINLLCRDLGEVTAAHTEGK